MARGDGLQPSSPPKNGSIRGEMRKSELHPTLVPEALRVPWDASERSVPLFSYSITLLPLPPDRVYRPFGLFLRSRLPAEAESMEVDLHLAKRRIVRAGLVPSGPIDFDASEIAAAEMFQEMWLKVLLDRAEFHSERVRLGDGARVRTEGSTFYLLLPVLGGGGAEVDWGTVRRCLSSPTFCGSEGCGERGDAPASVALQLKDGPVAVEDLLGSLVFNRRSKAFFFVEGMQYSDKPLKGRCLYPEQPLLHVKRLFSMHNLLLDTLRDTTGKTEVRSKEEHFQFLAPESCVLKILGFSKDIGSSLSLLPSMMHHLQNLLVAIELKTVLSVSFSEASLVTGKRVFESLTSEQCLECSSFERLEFLGDAFLKYVVTQHEFRSNESMDEGQLTDRRRNTINNLHLYDLAVEKHLQVYIHDEPFSVSQFFALGRPCRVICSNEMAASIHVKMESDKGDDSIKCTKSHRWLHRETIADVVEALIGAFLIDAGFTAAIGFMKWIGIAVAFEFSDVHTIMQNGNKNLLLFQRTDASKLNLLENALSYTFKNRGLLLEALVHPSYANHTGGSYQRLEFLGDSALDYLITSYIYSVYPALGPGNLSTLRSIAVNNGAFAQVAIHLQLHLHIIKNSLSLNEAIGKFETFVLIPDSEKDFLEEPPCPKVLADIVESCFGAILVDSGFDLKCIWEIFLSLLAPILSFDRMRVSPIRELKELCPGCEFKKFSVGERSYKVEVKASVNDECLLFSATNPNSNTAAKMASQKALHKLKDLGHRSKRKSLEETLSSTRQEAAQLIGFDKPIMSRTHSMSGQPVQHGDMNLYLEQTSQEGSVQSVIDEISCININNRALDLPSNLISTASENGLKSNGIIARNEVNGVDGPAVKASLDSNDTYDGGTVSAKMYLFNLCVVNNLCPPSFKCLRESLSSSCNDKVFMCKVTVIIEAGTGTTTLECLSELKSDAVSAEEEAAEGAIWYLKHDGFRLP